MTYKASDIKVLDEMAHIRLAPGMYIGDTSRPDHLLEECFDNSLDECFADYASIVAINIDTKKHIYSVIDNGRGIPIENDVAKIISTKLFSGAKFQDSKTAYKIVSGMHGIGLCAVNALSTDYTIEIYRDNKYAIYKFVKSKLKSKKIIDYTGKIPFSTKIQFSPDEKIFESLSLDLERVRRRLLVASVELPKATFVLNLDSKREVIKVDKEKFFLDQCISGTKKGDLSQLINIESEKDIEKFNLTFCYDYKGAITPKIVSSINILPVDSGGTHVNLFYEILRDIFVARAKKSGVRILPQDCFCGLRAYLSLSLVKPEFSGQDKSKLINRKTYLEVLGKKLKIGIDEWFNKNPEEVGNLIEFFGDYRKKIDAKSFKSSPDGQRTSTKFTKLRDCKSRSGELFIVEGDSAAGCISLATKIKLADGRNISLKQIIKEFNEGEELFVYTYDHSDQRIKLEKIQNAHITKRNAELVKVIIDTGDEIIATPDHRFLLRNGEYKQAQHLKEGDGLMSLVAKLTKYDSNQESLNHALNQNLMYKTLFNNHKVIKVEKLDYKEDTGDITIPTTSNFALTCGIFIHNSFIACRNPNIHAVLPLKGKIPSAANAKDILKNKEIGEIIQSLGTGVGPQFDISKLRYDKIICACDADPDGGHIASLLTLALALLVPEVIKQGKYYIVETPLHAINEKKYFIPLWTEEELNKARTENKTIIRLKGLGELNPNQLKQVAVEPNTRKLNPVYFTTDIVKMTSLFISAEEKRKLLEGKWEI